MTIRLGGAFPFTPTDVNRGGSRIVLQSGQAFYPPPGNYIARLGTQTNLQWFDPVTGAWVDRGYPTSYRSFNTDGFNWRMINLSGVVIGAQVTAGGSGATNGIGTAATGVSIAFTGPGVTGASTPAAFPIVGGSVPAPSIVQAGSGFLVPPLIVCDPPPFGGIQATFTCTLNSSGGIASVSVVSGGAGYVNVPNFYIIPQTAYYQGATPGGIPQAPVVPPGFVYATMVPPGSAPGSTGGPGLVASATASGALLAGNPLTGSGTLTGIIMYQYGSFYTGTTIPTISITGITGATANPLMSMCMTGVSGLTGGSGYGATGPTFATSIGLVETPTANAASTLSREAIGTTTVVGGVVTGVNIEDPGYGFQKVPALYFNETGAASVSNAVATVVTGSITDVNILQAQFST